MSSQLNRYTLSITPTARRQLAETLPEAVALAAYEFIVGPLLDNPHRVGKRLHAPLEDRHSARRGTYRVIYRIDDENRTVSVVDIAHRPSPRRLPREGLSPTQPQLRPEDAASLAVSAGNGARARLLSARPSRSGQRRRGT